MSISDQIADIADQISDLPLATAIRTGSSWRWTFPTIETVHVIAISTVFGSIVMLDLRLLGVGAPGVKVSKYSSELLPVTWTAFALAAATGTLLFISRAPHYVADLQFCLKMGFILLAGLNMLVFQLGVYRGVERWDSQLPPPPAARIAGLISIACWTTVVFLGRWIGFTT
jgi:hypothetical protein